MGQRFLSDIHATAGVKDSSGDLGSDGQVLSSTGTGTNWVNQEDGATVIYDDQFTATAGQTAFTLSNTVDAENKTQVYIDGAYQAKAGYTVSGNTLTFDTGLDVGSEVEVITFATALANNAAAVIRLDEFTGNNSTTDFTLAQGVADEKVTQVYINGVYQHKDTYSITDVTLAFSTAPPTSADIEVITFDTLSSSGEIQASSTALYVKNTSGSTIAKGIPVYITGSVGNSNTLTVSPANASNASHMPATGLLLTTLANNSFGYIITNGFLKGLTTDTIDSTSTSSNDTIYVKAGGGLTMTKPTGTNLIQNIGKVARSSGGDSGSILVSSILRSNDIPNIASGKIWVGDSNAVATERSLSGDATLSNTGVLTLNNSSTALDLKANIAGPTFTGTPAAPTASAGTNTTQLATTAFVTTGIANIVDSSPAALNTLNELAAALGDDANFSTTVTNSIATKAPLASPTFTGNVRVGTSTETANTNFDNLVIEGVSGHSGITIFSKSDSDGAIYFGDVEANNLGQIKYSHSSNAMTFATNDGSPSLTLDSGNDATFSGKLSVSKSSTNFIAEFQNTNGTNPYGLRIKDASSPANNYPLFSVSNSGGTVEYFRVNSGTGNSTFSGDISLADTKYIQLNNTSTDWRLRADNAGRFVVQTSGGSEFFKISSGGIVGIGSTGIFAGTNAILNLQGSGIALKNDKNGSNNNWSYIQNTGTGSNSDINFYTGNNASALNLSHSGVATFSNYIDTPEVRQGGEFMIGRSSNVIRMGSGDSSDSLAFYAGASQRLSISSGGEAIFTGTIKQSAATSLLTLNDSNSDSSGSTNIFQMTDYANNVLFKIAQISGGLNAEINQVLNGNLDFKTNNTSRLTISSGGLVGIGRTNPSSKLHLDGSNYNTASETQFTITDHGNNYNSGDTSCRIVMESRYWSGDDNVSTRSAITNIKDNGNGSSGSAMAFHTTNQGAGAYSEKMRISSGGTVQIYGTASANSLNIDHDSGNNVTMAIPFLNTSQDFVIRNSSAGVNLDYAATSWVSASDENIKENITSLDNVLDKIKNIRCVNYNLKDEEIYKKRLGFIAQDFQENFEEVTSINNNDVLGLRYTETIPILLKAIQEQQTIIEDLKARIETLEV